MCSSQNCKGRETFDDPRHDRKSPLPSRMMAILNPNTHTYGVIHAHIHQNVSTPNQFPGLHDDAVCFIQLITSSDSANPTSKLHLLYARDATVLTPTRSTRRLQILLKLGIMSSLTTRSTHMPESNFETFSTTFATALLFLQATVPISWICSRVATHYGYEYDLGLVQWVFARLRTNLQSSSSHTSLTQGVPKSSFD